MRRSRRLAIVGLTATAVATAAAAVVLTAPLASADVPGFFVTWVNNSDPHIITCTDPSTSTNGYCLYTSRDMGQQYAYPGANYYPMRDTHVYFSPNGYNQWTYKGVAFTESQLDSWVPRRNCTGGTDDNPAPPDTLGNCRAYHLWAPAAVRVSSNTYHLYVPDVSNTSDPEDPTVTPNIHTSSRIAVGYSTSPFGPFLYWGTVPHDSGYMSDPDVLIDGSNRYLVWADGDYSTCGGFKSAKLEPNMLTLTSGTTQTLTINGLGVLGSCVPDGSSAGIGRPYAEGASLYKRTFFPGHPYTLIFAAKPDLPDNPELPEDQYPAECRGSVGGTNSNNEVIAWASAASAQGPYQYRGILMCGSTTEWTNQATITVTSGPNPRLIMIYHDGAANKQRSLQAECLFYSPAGIIGGVRRQPVDEIDGFNACTNGIHATYQGLSVFDPQYPNLPRILHTTNTGAALTANRFAVGQWERYDFETVPGSTARLIRALANGKLVCAGATTVAMAPTCTDPSLSAARFTMEGIPSGNGTFYLKSWATGKYVSIVSDGTLRADATTTADAARFNRLGYVTSW